MNVVGLVGFKTNGIDAHDIFAHLGGRIEQFHKTGLQKLAKEGVTTTDSISFLRFLTFMDV